MDVDLTANTTLTEAVTQAHTQIDSASMPELLMAVAVPLLALLIGIKLNRFIDSRPHTTLGLKIIDFGGPLLSPTLAMFFSLVAGIALHYMGVSAILIPFILKCSVAWFAVQLVILMSTRQSAGWLIACVVMPITLLHLFNLWEDTTKTLAEVSFSVGSVKMNLYLIIKGVIILVALQWLASFAVRLTDNRLRRIKSMRASNRTLIVKMFQIGIYCFVFLFGMQLLGINLTALSVFGGALGVGLGFGLQKIASNFISGIILLFEKSSEIGDLIELADGTTGFIRQTYARYTLLETQDGKEVLIPNEEFISQRVISWTHSDKAARGDITVSVSYESDVELARTLMLEAASAHPKRHKTRAPMCVVNAFGDSGVQLTLYFWVADVTDGRMEPKSDMMRTILKSFREHHITIPYPQREMRVIAGTIAPEAPEPPAPKTKKASA